MLCFFLCRGAEFPPNTMSPGPRPISVPSGILIRPTVWPQYISVSDRQDTQTGQRSRSIGWTLICNSRSKTIYRCASYYGTDGYWTTRGYWLCGYKVMYPITYACKTLINGLTAIFNCILLWNTSIWHNDVFYVHIINDLKLQLYYRRHPRVVQLPHRQLQLLYLCRFYSWRLLCLFYVGREVH